jgi:hypothetical protein
MSQEFYEALPRQQGKQVACLSNLVKFALLGSNPLSPLEIWYFEENISTHY